MIWRQAAVVVILGLLSVSLVQAATFVVNSPEDVNDLSPGNGLCVAYLIVFPPFVFPSCTLRAAIEEANALPGVDTVVLGEGEYRLTLVGAGEDRGGTGDLDITDSLVLVGAGADATIVDGNRLDRVLDIAGPDIRVTVSALTLRGGLLAETQDMTRRGGAGIRNQGLLSMADSVLTGNTVQGLSEDDAGGGLANSGTSFLENSSVAGNYAHFGGGIVNGPGAVLHLSASTVNANRAERGAGILNAGDLRATNVTVSGNVVSAGGDTGGGLENQNRSALTQCTIAGNSAALGGGISNSGIVVLQNTIVATNSGGDCRPGQVIDSEGWNLAGDTSCGLGLAAGDRQDLDPLLEPLGFNGGVTLTHALKYGSPAIDAAILRDGVVADQRGVLRPQGKRVDIGAYERVPVSLVPLLMPLLLK